MYKTHWEIAKKPSDCRRCGRMVDYSFIDSDFDGWCNMVGESWCNFVKQHPNTLFNGICGQCLAE